MSDANRLSSASGGGIVFGGAASRSAHSSDDVQTPAELGRVLRRRWPTGVSVVTTRTSDGDLRGVTVGSLMMVSLDPPTLAIGLASESSFHELLPEGAFLGVSILKSAQEFTSERFAGRGPVPNRAFAGIPYDIMPPGAEPGVPILRGSLGWCRCVVRSRSEVGDHVLVLAAIVDGELGIDSEDPLLSYEAQYRGLELL